METKYLYKYVIKGPDRAMVTTKGNHMRDEIKDYEDMRSAGSSEACLKIFEFQIAENNPLVQVFLLLQIVLGYHLFSGFVTTHG